MYEMSFTSKFIKLLVKLKILQSGDKISNYGFTVLWTLVGMIAPVGTIIFHVKAKTADFKGMNMDTIFGFFWRNIITQIHSFLIIPVICLIGLKNPSLIENLELNWKPTRPFLFLICLLEFFGFSLVLFVYRRTNDMIDVCPYDAAECLQLVLMFAFVMQSYFFRGLALIIVSISSRQVVDSLKTNPATNIDIVSKHVKLFKETKSSLSPMLFITFTFQVLDCIVRVYDMYYREGERVELVEYALLALFSCSFVVYYCVCLDDCYNAYKDHISTVR